MIGGAVQVLCHGLPCFFHGLLGVQGAAVERCGVRVRLVRGVHRFHRQGFNGRGGGVVRIDFVVHGYRLK